MFFSQYFSFPLWVPFHHCSILIHPPGTHAVFFSKYFTRPVRPFNFLNDVNSSVSMSVSMSVIPVVIDSLHERMSVSKHLPFRSYQLAQYGPFSHCHTFRQHSHTFSNQTWATDSSIFAYPQLCPSVFATISVMQTDDSYFNWWNSLSLMSVPRLRNYVHMLWHLVSCIITWYRTLE